MKTCEIDGCDGVVKHGATHFCSKECSNRARTFRVYTMIEDCACCAAKMMESDYHKELSGTACSRFCKACRVKHREDRVAEKVESRKAFLVRFSSMTLSGCIKF